MSKLNAILPSMMPDFVRFLLIVAAMAGAIYGSALALATFPPEPSDVTSSLPHEKLRQD